MLNDIRGGMVAVDMSGAGVEEPDAGDWEEDGFGAK